jgi:cardiolipin synthase
MLTNLPNLLTMARIVLIPLIVAAFFAAGAAAHWLTLGLFAVAGATDYFDGRIARARGQQTAFGRFLDPVADKLLVAAVILMLVAQGWITGWLVLPALVILLREILISGLREFLAGLRVDVPVSRLAKWKTAVQFAALALLLLGDAGGAAIGGAGAAALWIAGALTLYTGFDYLRAGLGHIARADAKSPSPRPAAAEPADSRR